MWQHGVPELPRPSSPLGTGRSALPCCPTLAGFGGDRYLGKARRDRCPALQRGKPSALPTAKGGSPAASAEAHGHELPQLQYALAVCPAVRNAVPAPRSRSEETGQGHALPVAAQPVAVGTQSPAAWAGAGSRLPAGCSQPLPLPDPRRDGSGSLIWGPPLLGDSQLPMENKSPITLWSPPASNSSCSSDAPRTALSRTGH